MLDNYKSKYLELKQSGAGFFCIDSYTESMQKKIYNKFHKGLISKVYTDYSEYKDIKNKLKSNFINDNTKLEQEITTQLDYKDFTKISLNEANLKEVEEKTNLNDILIIIDELMNNKQNYNTFFIEKLKNFLLEIKKLDNNLAKIKDIKYRFEFKNILELYISFLIAFIKMNIPKNIPETVWDNGRPPDNSYTRPGAQRRS
jgi:hypothetical protein